MSPKKPLPTTTPITFAGNEGYWFWSNDSIGIIGFQESTSHTYYECHDFGRWDHMFNDGCAY